MLFSFQLLISVLGGHCGY